MQRRNDVVKEFPVRDLGAAKALPAVGLDADQTS